MIFIKNILNEKWKLKILFNDEATIMDSKNISCKKKIQIQFNNKKKCICITTLKQIWIIIIIINMKDVKKL